ncbi:hypothetical protein [uncultured Flavobacterium sp.]|uniref:hypothetical protein n=1 Tax=uncultured Flavobacterium sp. TaxID=165435 RepID=UPI0025E4EFBE|nr:hypothetical protein [uncultured Flavobacterium sp.]
MDPKGKDIIISEGRRPAWHRPVSCLCYAGVLGMICLLFLDNALDDYIDILQVSVGLFLAGMRFSAVTNLKFDLPNRRFKKELALWKIKIGNWEYLPNIEYVSVFKKEEDVYDVNVWYNTSRHFTIFTSEDIRPAYDMAYRIALRLDVDMLDATVKNNSVWVRLDKEMQ